jgi:hypothetical protein
MSSQITEMRPNSPAKAHATVLVSEQTDCSAMPSNRGAPVPGGRPNAEPGAGAPAAPRGGAALI